MTTLRIKSIPEYYDFIKGFIFEGLEEERRKLQYAFDKTLSVIKDFEKKFSISTEVFIEKFKKGEIEENEETFDWWAETKIAKELERKLAIVSEIEICQE